MIHVTKATGLKEHFSEEKVKYSIHRAGIPDEMQNRVLEHVKSKLYEGIPTSEIFHHIIEFLGRHHPIAKAKYSLKQAIMDLGPTGYPFEDYFSFVLQHEGYTTQVRQILQGSCISHEIDIVAEKEGKKIMVEAKFHNGSGTRTDAHDALYTKARFDDIKVKHKFNEAWLVTNTKATIDAINYGSCVGMQVISWSEPSGQSFRDLIEKSKLYPITTLTTLSQNTKQQLLDQHIVSCKALLKQPEVLSQFGLSENEKKEITTEAQLICGI